MLLNIRKKIKKILVEEDLTLTEVVNRLNEKYNRNDTIQNLSNKLSRETLKYKEAIEIASVIGYEIVWNKKE